MALMARPRAVRCWRSQASWPDVGRMEIGWRLGGDDMAGGSGSANVAAEVLICYGEQEAQPRRLPSVTP